MAKKKSIDASANWFLLCMNFGKIFAIIVILFSFRMLDSTNHKINLSSEFLMHENLYVDTKIMSVGLLIMEI